MNSEYIAEILANSFPKMKKGATAVHQYSDWEKLDKCGWDKGGILLSFKELPDDDIWWPRNN